ncbi:homologous-pairing protein 2 homolog [Galendromus occidentalis]|uniref:Homologous-pairing protein 2 homolog n=1 Tax=Galendromus occidentalis TaxID=34638 RepID=A0AAJ6QVK5_9ACAR|nr:homologous-pairing protein 2 homolog [Galendromus occidentalis]
MEPTAETVLNYLKEQNRPYSVTDIFNNLHKAIGKTVLQRDLDSLVGSGEVVGKTYGKQRIYYVSQEGEIVPPEEDVAAIDREIEALREEIASKAQHVKELRTQLDTLKSNMSLDHCRREIERFTELNKKLKSKIEIMEPREGFEIDRAELASLTRRRDILSKELKKRKKICEDALSIVLENCPLNKTELADEIGLEVEPS